jgi:hypothetical protein
MKGFKRLVLVAAALTLCSVSANGEANQDAVSSFSILATNSTSLEASAVVHSGSVGVVADMSLPEFPTPNPGSQPIDIGYGQTVSLQAGSYGDVTVRADATLVLGGGVYHFENLNMGENNAMLCFEKATELIINNRLEPGANAIIGPCVGSGIGASDIRIYVNGSDGADGSPNASPEAAEVGYENNVRANIYAPNGTILVKAGSVIEGALIGKDIIIGHDVEITLNSAFAEEGGAE